MALVAIHSVNSRADEAPATDDPRPFQSQSFLRLNDGTFELFSAVVQDFGLKCDARGNNCKEIIPNMMFMNDKKNPLPAIAKMGSNYLYMENGLFLTLSAEGFLTNKGMPSKFRTPSIPFTPGLLGGNYFLKEGTDQIVAIDSGGCFIDSFLSAGKIKVAGGNYFISSEGVLTTIKSAGKGGCSSEGMINKYNPPANLKKEDEKFWIFKDVIQVGGQFFVKADGTVVTISSQTGFYYGPSVVPSIPARVGGNYYIGQDHILYTMNNDGALAPHGSITKPIAVLGYSFILYADGTFTIIGGDGSTHEDIVQTSTTGISRQVIKQINLNNIDLGSIYLPKIIQ